MKNYVIYTDSCADLTEEMYRTLGLKTVQLDVIVEGEEPVSNDKVDIKEIYAKLRAKKSASTKKTAAKKPAAKKTSKKTEEKA